MSMSRFDFGGLIFSLTNNFSRLQRSLCRTASLYSGQPRVLTVLMRGQGLTLKELSDECRIGMPSLSVSVRNMVKSGLLRKEGVGHGQRIFLTEVGSQRAGVFHAEIDEFYKGVLESFGGDADKLTESIERLNAYLEEYNRRYDESHDTGL